MVERPPVIPPQPRRRRRRAPTPRRLAFRRLLAVVAVLVVVGFLAWGTFALVGSDKGSSGATDVLPPPPKPFKIVFPEGFTRRDMGKRITAVDKIALRERGVRPRLSRAAYVRATSGRRVIAVPERASYPRRSTASGRWCLAGRRRTRRPHS